MGTTHYQEAELFEPGEYIDTGSPGYFTVAGKPRGHWVQTPYETRHLPEVINGLNPRLDAWITQAVFDSPFRATVNLRSVGLLFSDLDTYNRPGLLPFTPEEQARQLMFYCEEREILFPSVVMFSGRGLQAKWLVDPPLLPDALPRWDAAQRALSRALEPFGADPKARDAARVLRIDRTVNTRTGEVCRVVHVTGDPVRYDFGELTESLSAWYPPASKIISFPMRERGTIASPSVLSTHGLNWRRVRDILRLRELRGGALHHTRELALFYATNFVLLAEPDADPLIEARELARKIDASPGWWKRSDLSTLIRKAREAREGVEVSIGGKTFTPLYTPKNQTLIDLFSITPTEERELQTIISRVERNRRRRERRGLTPRDVWRADSIERRKPWEAEGVSRRTWFRHRAAAAEFRQEIGT